MAQLLLANRVFFPFFLACDIVSYMQVLLANAYPCGSTSSFFSSILFNPCQYELKFMENEYP